MLALKLGRFSAFSQIGTDDPLPLNRNLFYFFTFNVQPLTHIIVNLKKMVLSVKYFLESLTVTVWELCTALAVID